MTDATTPAQQRRALEAQRASADLALAQDDQELAHALVDALAKPDVAALRKLLDDRYDATANDPSQALNRQLGYLKSVLDSTVQGAPAMRDAAAARATAAQAAVDAAG